jgi:hypothetical protein
MVTNYFENRKFHATDKTILGGLFLFLFSFFPGLGGGKVGITIWEHLGNLMGTHWEQCLFLPLDNPQKNPSVTLTKDFLG